MTTIDKIKIKLIERIQASDNEQHLLAIDNLLESIYSEKTLLVAEEQTKISDTTENEVKEDNLLSPEVLIKMDS